MANDVQVTAGSGVTIHTLYDSGAVQWPVGVVAYATALGTPNTLAVPLAAALADATTNPTVLLAGACMLGFNGTTWDRLVVDGSKSLKTTAQATTAGGATPYAYLAAASANQDSQVVNASPGQLYGFALFNVAASVRYVKFYNKATGPTSADTPVLVVPVPPSNGGTNLAFPTGLAFSTGLATRITTGQANNDANAATAADVVINIMYK